MRLLLALAALRRGGGGGRGKGGDRRQRGGGRIEESDHQSHMSIASTIVMKIMSSLEYSEYTVSYFSSLADICEHASFIN